MCRPLQDYLLEFSLRFHLTGTCIQRWNIYMQSLVRINPCLTSLYGIYSGLLVRLRPPALSVSMRTQVDKAEPLTVIRG